ncbi:hypothetical protein GUJ93_ZPchr0013g34836 [Zizania palustris]|uniref:NAC domain-containing protein n=1 Tax=Zizania palustris TaxID=103762 RepID=A0A8J5X0J4_ZIZPA|nr:hypothetical protein GUJ93_ZPchr0013g34836 [Zizania palustris]
MKDAVNMVSERFGRVNMSNSPKHQVESGSSRQHKKKFKGHKSKAMSQKKTSNESYSFQPSDDELITLFLRPKIAKKPFQQGAINVADVYSADPAELVARHPPALGTQGNSSVWYFFCPPRFTSKSASSGSGRRQRTIGGAGESVWKSEGGKKAVNGVDGGRIGYLQKFSYGTYKPPGRTFTRLGWCMVEFGIDDQDNTNGEDKQVLCKVYRSPRAVYAEARNVAAAAKAGSPCSGSKRKADDDGMAHPDAPPSVRRTQTETIEDDKDSHYCLPDDFDLDNLLSFPMDDTVEVDPSEIEEMSRYMFGDLRAEKAGVPCSGSIRKADDDDVAHPDAPPSVQPTQTIEGDDESQCLPDDDFDLDNLLSFPMDDTVEVDHSEIEEMLRYMFGDLLAEKAGVPCSGRSIRKADDDDVARPDAPPSGQPTQTIEGDDESQCLPDDLDMDSKIAVVPDGRHRGRRP